MLYLKAAASSRIDIIEAIDRLSQSVNGSQAFQARREQCDFACSLDAVAFFESKSGTHNRDTDVTFFKVQYDTLRSI